MVPFLSVYAAAKKRQICITLAEFHSLHNMPFMPLSSHFSFPTLSHFGCDPSEREKKSILISSFCIQRSRFLWWGFRHSFINTVHAMSMRSVHIREVHRPQPHKCFSLVDKYKKTLINRKCGPIFPLLVGDKTWKFCEKCRKRRLTY